MHRKPVLPRHSTSGPRGTGAPHPNAAPPAKQLSPTEEPQKPQRPQKPQAPEKPMVSKRLAKDSTSVFSFRRLPGGLSFSTFLKSASFAPLTFWTSDAMSMASPMNLPTWTKSCSTRPRDVIAGVPTRRPLGVMALLSPGMVFLFRIIETCSHTISALLPLTPLERRSRRSRWLSVPPETRLKLLPWSDSPRALAFFITCSWYCLNSGCMPALSATASAVIDWLWGPPWRPGKTAALIFSSRSHMMGLPCLSTPRWPLRKKIMAPLGPRSDLCVVVVTMSAYSKGDGSTPPTTRPEMCAMSAIR
mmetsp:Transcript_24853/g.65664  ORF Transcript_24853/g.65664 Transcript_24853/m.65664 type:complete len:304 (-) Transcript_24853:778-1689(-)